MLIFSRVTFLLKRNKGNLFVCCLTKKSVIKRRHHCSWEALKTIMVISFHNDCYLIALAAVKHVFPLYEKSSPTNWSTDTYCWAKGAVSTSLTTSVYSCYTRPSNVPHARRTVLLLNCFNSPIHEDVSFIISVLICHAVISKKCGTFFIER